MHFAADNDFWNQSGECILWLNFRGADAETLPLYDDLAVALLSYDKVFIEYRGGASLSEWITRDLLFVELLRSDSVGLITDAYIAGGLQRLEQTEWLPEHDRTLYDLIIAKQKNTFHSPGACRSHRQ